MGQKDSPIIIHDLSRNGTFVNGERIGQEKQRILFTGDKISVLTEDLLSKYICFCMNIVNQRETFGQRVF